MKPKEYCFVILCDRVIFSNVGLESHAKALFRSAINETEAIENCLKADPDNANYRMKAVKLDNEITMFGDNT